MIRRLAALSVLVLAAVSAAPAIAQAAEAAVTAAVSDPILEAGDPTPTRFTLDLSPDDQTLAPIGVTVVARRFDGMSWVVEDELSATAERTDPGVDHAFDLDLSRLADSTYDLVVRGTWTGAPSGPLHFTSQVPLTVDRVRPTISSADASPSVVYPERDGYRDTSTLNVSTADRAHLSADIVRVATGAVVRTVVEEGDADFSHSLVWDGRTTAGLLAPAGAYVARLRAIDDAGNVVLRDLPLTVRGERLTWVTWSRTLTPGQALKHRNVGACSSLRPGVNGWRGGLGLWSNTRCRGTGQRSVAEAIYTSKVPRAGVFDYGAYSVTTRGRSDASRPGSRGVISLYRAVVEDFPRYSSLPARYTATRSHVLEGSTAVSPEGWVGWSTFVSGGNRYDVRSFVVRLRIQVLR